MLVLFSVNVCHTSELRASHLYGQENILLRKGDTIIYRLLIQPSLLQVFFVLGTKLSAGNVGENKYTHVPTSHTVCPVRLSVQ